MAVQPDADRKKLISQMFVSGMSSPWWYKLDALWVHAAHEAQAGRLNWLGDNYNCIPVNNPVFMADRGYTFDGSSNYLDTQFNPASAVSPKYTRDSGSLGVRMNTDGVGTSIMGLYDVPNNIGTSLNPKVNNTEKRAEYRVNQGSVSLSPDVNTAPTSIGMHVANRTSSTDVRGYRNGNMHAQATHASLPIASGRIRIGSATTVGYRAGQVSMSFIGGGLTNKDVKDIFDWFEPCRTALGVV